MDFNGRPSAGGGAGGDVSFESVCATTVQAYQISQAAACGATPNYTLPLSGPPTQTPSQLSVMTAASTLTNNIRITVPSSLQYVVHRGISQLAYVALQPGDYPLETALFPLIETALQDALYAIGGVGTFSLDLNAGKVRLTTSPGNNSTQVDIWSETQDPTVVNYLLGMVPGVQTVVAVPADIPFTFPNFPTYVVITSPALNWSPYFSAPIQVANAIVSDDGATSITALDAPANPSIVSQGDWGFGGATLSNVLAINADPAAAPFTIAHGTTLLNMSPPGFEFRLAGDLRVAADAATSAITDAANNSYALVSLNEAHLYGNASADSRASVVSDVFTVNLVGTTRLLADPTDTWQYSPNALSYTDLSDTAHSATVNSVVRLLADGAGTTLAAEDGLTSLAMATNSITLSASAAIAYFADNSQSVLVHQASGSALGVQSNQIIGAVASTPVLNCDATSSYFVNASSEVGVNAAGAYTAGPLNAGGIINAQAGAAATPSVVFDGDLTTGLLQPVAATVATAISGVETSRTTSVGLAVRTDTTAGVLRIGDRGTPGSSVFYIENTAVADGASPYGYISMIGGTMNIGKASRGSGNPLVFTDALTVATTARLNAGVGLTLRGEPNNVQARLFTTYGSVQINGITNETALYDPGTAAGSAVIAASSAFLAVGSTLRFEAAGTLDVSMLNTVRFRIRASTGGIGGTVVFDTGAISTIVVGAAYSLSVKLTVFSATFSKAYGTLTYGSNSQAFFFSTASFSSAVSNTFSLTGQYTAAGDTLVNQVATIESAG